MNPTQLAMMLGLCALPQTANADILVRFIEGAPTDRFEITNAGACALAGIDVVIDLAGSAGRLIFDVTGTGAGVQVYQPFVVTAGADALATLPQVADGDRGVTLAIRALPAGGQIAFTIDVDDTRGQREITVSNSEIEGAGVRVGDASGVFTRQATARVPMPPCAGA
jgi:hypothetical protein